jgi:hypothetical protein
MKTTIEIPDPLFRKVKATAAERGQSLRELVTEALRDKLGGGGRPSDAGQPGWMQGFGALRRLHRETARVQSRIDDMFEVIESEDRA